MGGAKPRLAVALAGPYQAAQPPDVVVNGDIEGIEVQPGAPGHVGHPDRQRDPAGWPTAQHRRVRICAGYEVTVVVVGVPVREQREAGARANLQERQRLGEHCQRGQERGASGWFVGLRPAGQHGRRELAGPIRD